MKACLRGAVRYLRSTPSRLSGNQTNYCLDVSIIRQISEVCLIRPKRTLWLIVIIAMTGFTSISAGLNSFANKKPPLLIGFSEVQVTFSI